MSDPHDDGLSATLPRSPATPGLTGSGGGPTLDSLRGTERFETGGLIGRGGMGEVFGCTDVKLKRSMALKQATSRAPADLERFVREARVQGQLQHPSIVPVHELGLTPEGLPYFTMKRVLGETLSEVLEALGRGDLGAREKYSRRRLLTAFGSVCQAIEFAHAQGVLHRDLKPANVMLGDFGEVYVLDWGLAKVLGQDDVAAPSPGALGSEAVGATPTVAGSLLGTPGYMAPELVLGEPATAQSDVFALGSLLFELLTTRRMVPGESVTDILRATRDGFEPSARKRCPDAEVAPELDAVVQKACARAPRERFASVRALYEATERILAGERDLELRAQMATAHAAKAAAEVTSLSRGEGLDDLARRRALQDVGRSLALDPNNTAAFSVLLRLLQTPPRETPAEVTASLRESAVQATRTASGMATIGFAMLCSYTYWFFQMGVTNPLIVWAMTATIVIAGIASFAIYRQPRPRPELAMVSVVALMVVGGTMNIWVLPFITAPALITVAALAYTTLLPARLRVVTVLMAMVAMAAPFLAQWAGLTDAPLHWSSAGVTLSPRVVALDPNGTMGLILDSTVFTVVMGAIGASRLRRALDRAQERIATQAWNLRQLLPPNAGDATLLDNSAADPSCAVEDFFEGQRRRIRLTASS